MDGEVVALKDEVRYDPAEKLLFGSIAYFRYGYIHRIDGPAFVYTNGITYYCRYGIHLTKDPNYYVKIRSNIRYG